MRREITAPQAGSAMSVDRMHDGSMVRFRKTDDDYDPTDRDGAYAHVRQHQERGEVVTGLLYIDEHSRDMHDINQTTSSAARRPAVRYALSRERGAAGTAGGLPLERSLVLGRKRPARDPTPAELPRDDGNGLGGCVA